MLEVLALILACLACIAWVLRERDPKMTDAPVNTHETTLSFEA